MDSRSNSRDWLKIQYSIPQGQRLAQKRGNKACSVQEGVNLERFLVRKVQFNNLKTKFLNSIVHINTKYLIFRMLISEKQTIHDAANSSIRNRMVTRHILQRMLSLRLNSSKALMTRCQREWVISSSILVIILEVV